MNTKYLMNLPIDNRSDKSLINKYILLISLFALFYILVINEIKLDVSVRYFITLMLLISILIYKELAIPFLLFIGITQSSVKLLVEFPIVDIYIFSFLLLFVINYNKLLEIFKNKYAIIIISLFLLSIFLTLIQNLNSTQYIIFIAILFLSFSLTFSTKNINLSLYAILLSGIFLSLIVLFRISDFTSAKTYGSSLEYYRDRNHLSSLISLSVVVAAYFLITGKNYLINIGLILLFLLVQLVIASRAGIFTSIIMLLYMFLFDRNKKKLFPFIFGGSILVFFFFLINNTSFVEILTNRVQSDDLSNMGGRTEIWGKSFDMFIKSDILSLTFGVGYHGSYEQYADGFSIHNNYLEILYDFGIIGFFILIYFLFLLYKKSSSVNRALFLCVLIVALSLSPFGVSTYWIIMGYLIAQSIKPKVYFGKSDLNHNRSIGYKLYKYSNIYNS